MAYIHVYKGNPTAGGVDGQQVSEETELMPITTAPLQASVNQEGQPIKLAIRCETGWQTGGDTVIIPGGPTTDKWALAHDVSGVAGVFMDWGASLTIANTITDVNTVFWVKARAISGEAAGTDTSADLLVTYVIVEV